MTTKPKTPAPGEIKRHGDGIYAKWCPTLYGGKGGWSYFIQYRWPVKGGKKRTEKVPASKVKGVVAFRLEDARRLKKQRDRDRYLPDWVPPKVAEQRKREEQAEREAEAAAAQDRHRALLFEVASEDFLRENAHEYANQHEVERVFRNRLALALTGRYLDELTRPDIRQYYLDRLGRTGPFADWPHEVGIRAPQTEITLLSALYTWLADAGHAIENPCHRPRTRRKDSPLAPYRPKRKKVVPSREALGAIFSAKIQGEDGRELVRDQDRSMWQLVYYTAARPESEPCRLTHADVELPAEDGGWGAVTYRNTKTGGDRRLPLHPAAAAALKGVMEPVPHDAGDREAWRVLPIFRKRGSRKPWDRASYKKAWKATLRAVAKDHPELLEAEPRLPELVLRDLRSTAKTTMVDAGVAPEVVDRILGHRGGVRGAYYVERDERLQRALETLTVIPLRDASSDAAQGAQGAQRATLNVVCSS